jgi:hypothetical protein
LRVLFFFEAGAVVAPAGVAGTKKQMLASHGACLLGFEFRLN